MSARLLLIIRLRQRSLYHDRTFHALALKLAANVISVLNCPVEVVGVRRAAAAAVELRKAVSALLFRVDVAALELIHDLRLRNPLVHISHQIFVNPDKLMARIEISPRRHGKILCAGAAAGQPLVHARPAAQIDHIVEKGKSASFFLTLHHLGRQAIVLGEDRRQILLPERVVLLGRSQWVNVPRT